MRNLRAGIIPYFLDNGKINLYLMTSKNSNSLQIAKGKIERNEDIQEAAVREGEEELGLKRNNFANSVVFADQDFVVGDKEKYTFYCYIVPVINFDKFDMPSCEAVNWAGWVSEEDAIAQIKNKQKNLLLSAINKIKQDYQGG